LELELVWLAGLLGEVRDRDILLERLIAQLRELPAEMVLGPVASHIETTLSVERSQHQARLVEAMDSDRYQALMMLILWWRTRPPLTRRAGKPAAHAQRYLRRAENKVAKRLGAARGDVEALHGARKAAKRYRYAAELTAQAGGRKARRIVKATTKLQTLLGEHQDSVVSAQFLRRLGAEAGAGGGQNGFTYGFLTAQEWQRAQQIREKAGRRWGNKSR
jgi:CHAD domain-containing protein